MSEKVMALSDRELVSGVRSGDLDAFAALVKRYRDAYTRFAVRMTGSLLDADDVMQSVWMRAFRNIGACKNPDRFGAWLYQIVVNECRTYTSRRAVRDNRFVDDAAESLAALTVAEPDVALREEIERALDCLPTDQREAFVLKHVEELSYDQIAEITGVGVSALKMRVCRACDRLRELLEGVHNA
jgi:RNA polymerase sigma-70 factor (ECF subfamily)